MVAIIINYYYYYRRYYNCHYYYTNIIDIRGPRVALDPIAIVLLHLRLESDYY